MFYLILGCFCNGNSSILERVSKEPGASISKRIGKFERFLIHKMSK